MKTCKTILLLLLGLISQILPAATPATTTVKGRVMDEQNQPIGFATATLLNSTSKKVVKGDISNDKGEFSIPKVEPGEYILSVKMIGYDKVETTTIKADRNHPVIEQNVTLRESSKALNEVVVTGTKKFVEQAVDKTIINPEASPTSASESVFDILRKLPGISIDNNDNISLKGMQGIKILIDDKPTYVSASQLATLLKGMQGKNVDKIEIIENPSARYDAEGNTGIINIKTKHIKSPGFNGNINAGSSIASKFGWNGGIDLNMNYNRFNLYGNYSDYNWAGFNNMYATRRFTSTELESASQKIVDEGTYKGNSHNYKIGLDFYLAKNQVISAMFRGNTGKENDIENNKTSFNNKWMVTDSSLVTTSGSDENWTNGTYNINYKWDIDTTGKSLSVDADYATFQYNGNNSQNGTYLDNTGISSGQNINVETAQGNSIRIFTAKSDYVLPLNKTVSLDAGLKLSNVTTDSHIDMSGYLNQNDHFIYKEAIQAAYVNGKFQFKTTVLQLGLRVENTSTSGNSVTNNLVKDTSYLKIFPSFFIQQQLKNKNSINFKYSYRIGRPNYRDLNPFRWMVDPYTYNVGNPNLNPQFTHSVGLTHNYDSKLITSLGLNYTTGLFTQIIKQDDASRTVFQTMDNLNNSLDMNISETFQFQPYKWWSVNGTATGMYKTIKMDNNNPKPLTLPSGMINLSNNFNLPYKINMEINARYSTSQLISNIITRSGFTLDIGLQKKVLKDQGMIKISVSDIFNTANGGAYAKYGNVDIDVSNKWDSRKLKLAFSYRFGKDNFKTRANRSTSSSEEQNRSEKN